MDTQRGRAPGELRSLPELMESLRRLKRDSGLSYRQLEERAAAAGDVLPRSTASVMLSRNVAPHPDQLAAFVKACGHGARVGEWLVARDAIAGRAADDAGEREPGHWGPFTGRPRRFATVALSVVVPLLAAAGIWVLTAADEPGSDHHPAAASASPGVESPLPGGWVRIRPVTAPGLCLTDGRVLDRRYTPLVAVQRRCADAAPQASKLEPMGGDTYRIQWHHPDYGKGCLKALSEGAGAGLLEPKDDCTQASLFHLEPSGSYTRGTYVLRVDGQGCVGIKDVATSEGAEAVMERCVGRGSQVFLIEPAP